MLASSTSGSQLLGKVVRNRGSKTTHDGRVKSLLYGTTGLLDLGLLLVNGRLRGAIFEDAVITNIRASRKSLLRQ